MDNSRTLSRMGIIFVFGVGYLLLLGRNTTDARSSTTTTCDECVSGKNDDSKNEERGNNGKLYPVQTFFVKTGEGQADEMAHQFAKYGKYHNYLTVNQIKSKFCLGHSVILRVSTDDTEFFNQKHAVWPNRPEVDWVADALRNQLKDVYYIHFDSYTEPPPKDDSDHQYEKIPKILINLNSGNRSTTINHRACTSCLLCFFSL